MAKNNDFLIEETDLVNHDTEYLETIFALGNGHFGVRASNPLKVNELYSGNPGGFVNGFFDSRPIQYGEWAYGYAKEHQTICNLPNLRGIMLQIGEEDSSKIEWHVKLANLQLDMATGVLAETYQITTPEGKSFELLLTSFASLKRQELFVCKYAIQNCNFSEPVFIQPQLRQQTKKSITDDPRVASHQNELTMIQKENTCYFQTENSKQEVAVRLSNSDKQILSVENSVTSIFQISSFYEKNNLPAQIFTDSFGDYDELLAEQQLAYQEFWKKSDIVISGNSKLQKGIRFNLFHLNQGAGRDGKTNFAAKALTGEGYEGHYFWDTEMYMLPFFIYTNPEVAKALLTYRYHVLEKAKARAAELDQKGALFAWRTIDGQETSAYYPAGTAQVHINADIAYAFQLYENVTGDETFIDNFGKEVIFETAKFWMSFGYFCEKDQEVRFCINGVTGPDEYSALVNNNFYTNKMVQNNLFYASELAMRYNLYETERTEWQQAAEKMYFPHSEEQLITPQDDGFLDQEIWDIQATPKDKFPLLLHYHPMIIYKYQVCKQADTILAEMLFTKDFSQAQLLRDYDYYEKVTTHDSSLSRSIFSVMASRLNKREKAYNYFMDTALMDLTDLQGNVVDGVHAANMGGSWLSLVYGFAGLQFNQGIHLTNHLPEAITDLSFNLQYQGSLLQIKLTPESIECILPENSSLIIEKNNQELWIKKDR
ncbi:alpha,alpha-trehalose phosphorylase [Enterococcus sp. PF1-24]|uniref:glycoside hydrolase family 65 protein n=1 Tax=unclassified Enterococcus TaxID=2608891 RepID=UPI002475E4D9|nr:MULTISPECIES: glycosyl hydrolase family 65 protein [unclassified Enterococcus]MDH6365315.1 alpha,alpha-trehalose phosphorylase [Enterococcus sp. PFB1-1]MDH6402429.1 alpha,alpha-trehalose phosphorylase [Enterococcus sp. PF1-24]